jgi:peptidoglycan hydrolase FlgJ
MTHIAPVASAASPANKDPALRKAAQGFEAYFLREVIGSMRKAKLGDDVFGSSATDNFRQMADAQVADTMAGLNQFGIATLLEAEFARKGGTP